MHRGISFSRCTAIRGTVQHGRTIRLSFTNRMITLMGFVCPAQYSPCIVRGVCSCTLSLGALPPLFPTCRLPDKSPRRNIYDERQSPVHAPSRAFLKVISRDLSGSTSGSCTTHEPNQMPSWRQHRSILPWASTLLSGFRKLTGCLYRRRCATAPS